MTIHDLLAAAGLSAGDEIPIWQVNATGEPTKKITAQQLAAAVATLASLVTGVKGGAESTYRTGQVNITPANLGAVSKSGDTMTGNLGIKAAWPSLQLYANGGSQETGTITSHKDNGRVYITEHSTDGTKEEYYQLPVADGSGTYSILTTKSAVGVPQGGTGATDAAGARTNLGVVSKSGDTMTGNLGIKATWPSVLLYANGGTQETGAITSHRDNGRVYIVEHSTDGTKEEYYQLPIADGNGTYGILTTKVPVSSSQGGTGGPYFFTCSGKTALTVKSSNGWGGFMVMSITASSAHLTAVGFNGSNAPNAVNIYGGDPGLNPQLSSTNTVSCTLRSDRHYIIIGTDKVTSISAS